MSIRHPRGFAAVFAGVAAVVVGGALVLTIEHGDLRLLAVVPAVVLGAWMSRRPAVALGVLVGSVIVFEQDSEGFLPITGRFYRDLPGHIFVTDVLLLAVIVAVVSDVGRRRRTVHVPASLALPLVVLAIGSMMGFVVGYLGGAASNGLLDEVRTLVYMLTVPLLTVQVLRNRSALRRFVSILAGLAILKGVVGLAGWLLRQGRPINGTHLTYYDPTANVVMLVFLATLVAARVAGVRMPRWMWWGAPFALLSLLLSFRRSFWIAGVLAVVLVVVVATSKRWRPMLGVGLAVLVIAGSLAASSIGSGGSQGSTSGLGARLASLSPSHIQASADDRYRLDEIHNVVHAISQHPLTGLGLGVPWTVVYPLSETHAGGTLYTHVNLLWFLMKLGPVGAAGYVLWYIGACVLGYRAWRRAREPLVRVTCLGGLVSLLGLAVAELTASFTGVDPRLTLVAAALVGFLAAAASVDAGVDGDRTASLAGPLQAQELMAVSH